ncbi:V-type ATP synthase subunit I [Desulfatiferula olefinivorans]
MTKVLIAGHLSECERFSEALQRRALIHLCELTDQAPGVFSRSPAPMDTFGASQLFSRLKDAHQSLSPWRREPSLVRSLLSPPRSIGRREFDTLITRTSPDTLVNTCRALFSKREALVAKREACLADQAALAFWNTVTVPLNTLGDHGSWTLALGTVPASKVQALQPDGPLDVAFLGGNQRRRIVLCAFHAKDRDPARDLLTAADFSPCPLTQTPESPALRFARNRRRLTAMGRALAAVDDALSRRAQDATRLKALLRHYGTLNRRSRIFETWLTSANAFLITGWVRSDRLADLNALVSSFDTLSVDIVRPGPGEAPPVALENRPVFAPFQAITRLYGHPAPDSLDPSPVLSIFFAVFFGITLTDAGYGLILVLLALAGLSRFKKGRDLWWIVFWGGVCTIPAGLLTGGIFGDLFRTELPFINAQRLQTVRDHLMWFDPMTEPMTFFRLVLLLGLVHVATGLVLGCVSDLRRHRPADALFDHAAWLVMLGALLILFFATPACIATGLYEKTVPPLPASLVAPAWSVVAAMALVITGFGARDESSLFFRVVIGLLKLLVLRGFFSYVGDILSYIRLMALGMVTAGIAMAVNTIAFYMRDIPVVGLGLTVLVLTAGHLLNLSINLLGGCVHTLRLQYVEFFSKFFEGGGEPFAPLSENVQYIDIRD